MLLEPEPESLRGIHDWFREQGFDLAYHKVSGGVAAFVIRERHRSGAGLVGRGATQLEAARAARAAFIGWTERNGRPPRVP